jgi:hypothetical protein
MSHVEVDEQAFPAPAQVEMRQDLRHIDVSQLPDGLGFDDNRVFDKEIEPKADSEIDSVVMDLEGLFGDDVQSAFSQFVLERKAIYPFQETGTKVTMDLHSRADYLMCQYVIIHRANLQCVRQRSVTSVVIAGSRARPTGESCAGRNALLANSRTAPTTEAHRANCLGNRLHGAVFLNHRQKLRLLAVPLSASRASVVGCSSYRERCCVS